MKVGDYVELADGSGVGQKYRYGRVIGWFGDPLGNGLRAGWRVTFGGTAVYPEHLLRVVTREEVEEANRW